MNDQILSILRTQNPWHDPVQGKRAFEARSSTLVERELLPELMKRSSPKMIAILEGPRRVGKTDLMFLAMRTLVEQKRVPLTQLIFVQCDDAALHTPQFFENIKGYIQELFAIPYEQVEVPLYIFLDEVSAIPNWEQTLKVIIDQNKRHYLTIASSTPILFQRNKDPQPKTLVGRAYKLRVFPFSFFESLALQNSLTAPLQKVQQTLQQSSVTKRSATELYHALQQIEIQLGKDCLATKQALLELSYRYLLIGGYPDFITEGERHPDYFTTMLDLLVHKDLAGLLNLKRPSIVMLERLIHRLLYTNTQIIVIDELQKEIGEKHQARASAYFHFLEYSQIFELLSPYTMKPPLQHRGHARKAYFIDPGLVHQCTGLLSRMRLEGLNWQGDLWHNAKGPAAETAVYTHLRRLGPHDRIGYYRIEKELEVDFIRQTSIGIIPIECKMRRRPVENDVVEALQTAIQKFRAPYALVITENELAMRQKNIVCIPLYYFLSLQDGFF